LVAKEVMFWITTRRIVAAMQDMPSIWYRTFGEQPRDSVRSVYATLEVKNAVTIGIVSGYPRPAFVRAALFNVEPKFCSIHTILLELALEAPSFTARKQVVSIWKFLVMGRDQTSF